MEGNFGIAKIDEIDDLPKFAKFHHPNFYTSVVQPQPVKSHVSVAMSFYSVLSVCLSTRTCNK